VDFDFGLADMAAVVVRKAVAVTGNGLLGCAMLPPSGLSALEFTYRTVLLVVGFTILIGAAVALNLLTAYAQTVGLIPDIVAWIGRALSYGLLAVDVVWFGTPMVVESWRYFWDIERRH